MMSGAMKKYSHIVLHIPHAGCSGKIGWPQTEEFFSQVKRWTDWYTDYLFGYVDLCTGPADLLSISDVTFPLSRFAVDVERLPDDPLEEIGHGKIYRSFEGIRRELTPEQEARLTDMYNRHHEMLMESLSPGSLLIDCHSFPSDLSDVDVCIGLNDDWSRPPQEVIDRIMSRFSDAGYRVGVNEPYSNSIAPPCPFGYHSVMIELNKRIYMDEATTRLTASAENIHRLIYDMYVDLLDEV